MNQPSEKQNPYSPPDTYSDVANVKQGSLVRGVAYAVPLACIGFVVLQVIAFLANEAGLLQMPYRVRVRSYSGFFFHLDVFSVPSLFLGSILGIAGFLNYIPAARLGLVRSVMYVGFVAGIAEIAVVLIVDRFLGGSIPAIESLGIGHLRPWVIAVMVSFTYASLHTWMRVRRGRDA